MNDQTVTLGMVLKQASLYLTLFYCMWLYTNAAIEKDRLVQSPPPTDTTGAMKFCRDLSYKIAPYQSYMFPGGYQKDNR